ncbi:MAG: DUF1549 domain-containing protein, partial [Armatimonadetes bacterium]|nr:DUF1549 domain-containing protein [Armatimonadota bacterium]
MSRPGRKRPCLPIRLLALGGGVLLLGLAVSGVPAAGPGSGPAGSEFFEKEVRPLLVLRCGSCHGATQPRGALNLVERGPALRGGGRGAAILPGRPERSLLIQAVRYAGELRMPPDGKLSGREQATLVRWVALGAPWPEARPAAAGKSGADRRRWWSFQPIRSGPPPPVRSAAWPRGELDRFLLAEMERRGLTPAPPADRRTWIRRATLDLTGLLPTPEEVTAFLLDRTETAHEQVVDRLLASPAYGQRWARHWLDVARYADYHDANPSARVESCEITEAWRYRDWVVDSLNRDLPYDQFIHHQIAGDLLPPPAGQEFNADGLVATTFLSNGVWDRGDADKEKIVSDMVDDNIDTIGKAFLGLTLGCARCHDHKFDPTTQRDYYALAGIFYSTHILKELGAKGGEYTVNRIPLAPRAVAVRREQQQQRVGEAQKQIEALDKKSPRTAAEEQERARLIGERDQLQQEIRAVPLAMAVQEGG